MNPEKVWEEFRAELSAGELKEGHAARLGEYNPGKMLASPQIEFGEYRELFEAIWRDRARTCGWKVAFRYEDVDTVLRSLPTRSLVPLQGAEIHLQCTRECQSGFFH